MRNLVVLSDGTGNSAGALNKTNVWRLYEALDLSGTDQIASFGDGVGTSQLKLLRLVGLALGAGVKKNTLQLYKFLCRNYQGDDRIYCFGFSRGAFTVRTLAGLIHHQGLVSFRTEEELDRAAIAAYRAYRKQAFATALPWVVAGRWLRDVVVNLWTRSIGARTYDEIKTETFDRKRHMIPIEFLGVWDTVVAYGLPVAELTDAIDKWVWPMTFRDDTLLPNVKCARHALSIDDERRTFFPLPWNEKAERELRTLDPDLREDRLLQIWFAGVHANVGGGYPDDSLSYVPLCWMIEHAAANDLGFRKEIAAVQEGLASPDGRLYDSRSGAAMLFRYQPRNVAALMGRGVTPIVNHSVVTRMALGYAPISLPYKIDVMPPYGPAVPFDGQFAASQLRDAHGNAVPPTPPAAARAMPPATMVELQESKKQMFEEIRQLDTAAVGTDRAALVELVQDTVWWRRLVYFVTLGLVIAIAAFPMFSPAVHFRGDTQSDDFVRGVITLFFDPFLKYLPGYLTPWISAILDHGSLALLLLVPFAVMLRLSSFLQRRIGDRSRAAWRVQARVDGLELDRLRLTGQQRASLKGMIIFSLLAVLAYFGEANWLVAAGFGVLAIAALILFVRRKFVDAGRLDVAHPGFLLALAHWFRTTPAVLCVYRWLARVAGPAFFLAVCLVGVLAFTHHATLAYLSNEGRFCAAKGELERNVSDLKSVDTADSSDSSFAFKTVNLCERTGIGLTKGRRYRVTLTIPPEDDWFDKSIWTDVRGFSSNGWVHYVALPIRRWWTGADWFQPIVRVGLKGNYEYALAPVEPLPYAPVEQCEPPEYPKNSPASEPASPELKKDVKKCANLGPPVPEPTRKLVAEFTSGRSGELYIFINDAMWAWNLEYFYKNNSGSAQVKVEPVLAPAVIPR